MNAVDQILVNIKYAARFRQSARIGGGIFDHNDLQAAAQGIQRLQGDNERLQTGLRKAIAQIEYLAPEKFDDDEHEANFKQGLTDLKTLLGE